MNGPVTAADVEAAAKYLFTMQRHNKAWDDLGRDERQQFFDRGFELCHVLVTLSGRSPLS